MGFPIVVGTKSVSSYALSSPEPVEEYAADGHTTLLPSDDCCRSAIINRHVCVTTTSTYQALIIIHYYELFREDNGEIDHSVAEVRVQISPTSEHFSTEYRESVFRFPLPTTKMSEDELSPIIQPQACFSADHKFLSCIIPAGYLNTLAIVFQLRRPRAISRNMEAPPLPSYILESPTVRNVPVVPVATNPKTLQAEGRTISSCCDALGSLLLLGCLDGSILVAGYRPATVLGTLHKCSEGTGLNNESQIVEMDFCAGQFSNGQLATVHGSGQVSVYRAEIDHQVFPERLLNKKKEDHPDDDADSFAMTLELTHVLPGSFACIQWVGPSHFAVLTHPGSSSTAQVYSLYDDGAISVVSSIEYTQSLLEDTKHTKLPVPSEESRVDSGDSTECSIVKTRILHDDATDCLTICSSVDHNQSALVFASLWHWRTNTQGFTIHVDVTSPSSRRISNELVFAKGKDNSQKLVHIVAVSTSSAIRKDVFDLGILSPRRSPSFPGPAPHIPLIVAERSVSYPRVSKTSACNDYELEWAEVHLPSHHRVLCGAPRLATMGCRRGRSIAVAGETGMCVLDVADETLSCPSTRRTYPKWFQFSSDTEARSFRVVSMMWWEATGEQSNDLLVAVIYVESEMAYFLSSWLANRLALDDQLMCMASEHHKKPRVRWGIRLPSDQGAPHLHLLGQPYGSDERKAVVLVSYSNQVADLCVFQLQLTKKHTEHVREPLSTSCCVMARLACRSKIGSKAHLFLAGASYSYDLMRAGDQDDHYLAVVAVIRSDGAGIDAVALSSAGVTHIAQVVTDTPTKRESGNSHLSTYWLAEAARRGEIPAMSELASFIWMLHLKNDAFIRWTVPCVLSPNDVHKISITVPPERSTGSTSVHPRKLHLGIVCQAGSAGQWMQVSAFSPSLEFPVLSMKSSCFACILGVSQECIRLHRSLGQKFESDSFRADLLRNEIHCPGSVVCHPPTFLPVLFSLLLDNAVAETGGVDGASITSYLRRKLKGCLSTETTLLALQLLSLRLVEKTTAARKYGNTKFSAPFVRKLFGILVSAIRQNIPRLQFATLFLEVGRQIEPSCFPDLFPLADTAGRSTGESLEDLVKIALREGSLPLAASALPLFSNYDNTIALCKSMFDWSLERVCMQIGHENVEWHADESVTISDILSYGIKLEDTSRIEFELKLDESFDDSNKHPNEYYSSDEESDRKPSFSLFCGLSRIFAAKKPLRKEETAIVEAATSFIIDGFNVDSKTEPPNSYLQRKSTLQRTATISTIAAEHLLNLVFAEEEEDWFAAGRVACFLIRDSDSSFRRNLPSGTRTQVVQTASAHHLNEWLPAKERVSGGLTKFLRRSIAHCEQELDSSLASLVVDLVGMTLDRRPSSYPLSRCAGLLLIGVISAHVSGRITEFLADGGDSLLHHCYWDAQSVISQ